MCLKVGQGSLVQNAADGREEPKPPNTAQRLKVSFGASMHSIEDQRRGNDQFSQKPETNHQHADTRLRKAVLSQRNEPRHTAKRDDPKQEDERRSIALIIPDKEQQLNTKAKPDDCKEPEQVVEHWVGVALL